MDAIGQKYPLAAICLDLEPHVKPAVPQSVPGEEITGFSRIGTRMFVLPHPPVIVMTVQIRSI